MTIDFDAFEEMEFPLYSNMVYVIGYVRGEGTEFVPFYVGESSRHVGRIGDYVSGQFTGGTDFRVGEAVKYLRERGLRVFIKFRESCDRKDEQNRIIENLRSIFPLLNGKGYNYKKADEKGERLKIRQFIDRILENPHPIEQTAPAPRKRASGIGGTSSVRSPDQASGNAKLSIPERVRLIWLICEELGGGGEVIKRQDVLRIAEERGINKDSVLLADHCDNTKTKEWSPYHFLHWVARGEYTLIKRLDG